jgi:hypothetical protein
MPQVLRAEGFAFYMYYNDHGAPHVHVRRAGEVCKIAVGSANEPPHLMDPGSMRRTDAGRALWMVNGCQEVLLAHWRRIREQDAY